MEIAKVRVYINRLILILVMSAAIHMSSCIKNDIPYPVVELSITNVEGEGFVMETPDYKNRIITLQLDETTDISNVEITDVSYSSQAKISNEITGTFDLRTPLHVVLSLYQDYEWTIVAKQTIDRKFKVAGQIGAEVIDAENHIAIAYVSEDVDLENVTIKELKLGPEGITTLSPSIEKITYFESYRIVEITYHSFEEMWRLYVEHTDVVVNLTQCDVWAKRAYLTAAGDSSGECGFYYRIEGSDSWNGVPEADITRDEGAFSAVILGLEADTNYEFKAFSVDDESGVIAARTEVVTPLTNGGLEEWSKPSSPWLPYLDASARFWDTGNPGSALISNITIPNKDDVRPGTDGTYSAELKSTKITYKFAAGNIFAGEFVKVAGSNGIISFGQPFTQRPTALKGWVKYNCGIIDMVGSTPAGVNIELNKTPDTGIIYIALGTWTPEEYGMSAGEMLGSDKNPIIIDTRDISTFFNPKSNAVLSYGELLLTESQDDWVEFEIPIEYNSTSQIPTHMVVVGSSSRYGDYFTGSTKSTMWIDDLELIYD